MKETGRRYWLSLKTWGGIVPGAYHWCPRIVWTENGQERDEDLRPKKSKEHAYTTKSTAMAAVLRWFKENAPEGSFLTSGSRSTIDPQEMVAGPLELRREANALWAKFETYDGWNAPKDKWPEVQKVCDEWEACLKAYWRKRAA